MNTELTPARDLDVPADEPFDRARLADVLRGANLSAAAFLAEFRRSTDADVQDLLDACDAGDLARVAQLAHRIEGASKLVGAGPMSQACRLVTAASRSGETGALRPPIDVLLECKQALYACLNEVHPAASPSQAGAEATELCAGLVFLVVEDHEFQRGMIMRLLTQLGALEVHGFADGASALAAAREAGSRAILLLDLAMPQLNGMDVMRVVGQERLALSVIMNSALGEDMLRWPLQTARSYGAIVLGAVSKPLTAAKLAPLLAQHRHDQRADVPCTANDVGNAQ